MEKKKRFLMTDEHLNFIRKAIEKEKEKDLDLNNKNNMINLKKNIFNIFVREFHDYCGSDEDEDLKCCFTRFNKMMNNNFFSNNPINSEKLFEIIFEFLRTKHGNVQKNKTIKTPPLMYLNFKDLATEYNKEEKNIITSKQIQNFLVSLISKNENKQKYKNFMEKLLLELNNEKTEIKEKECREELLKIKIKEEELLRNKEKELLQIIGKKEIIYEDDVGEEETYNSPSKLKGDIIQSSTIPESPGFFGSLWNFFSPTTHKTPPTDSKDSIGTFTLPSDTSLQSSRWLTFTPPSENKKRKRDDPPESKPNKIQRTSDGKKKKSSRKKSSRKKSSRKKSSRKRTICKK